MDWPSKAQSDAWLQGAHVGADADTALVEEISVTPGNVHDGRSGHGALPADPGDVYADNAYRGQIFAAAMKSTGGFSRVVQTGVWGREGDDALRKLKDWNYSVPRIRCRIEKLLEHGSAVTDCDACDGAAWRRLLFKSVRATRTIDSHQ